MSEETKTIKFPNGSTIILFSPKSGLQPKSQALHFYEEGKHTDVFYVPVLDIEALKVFEKFACIECEGKGVQYMRSFCEFPAEPETCPICKGSGSLYREAASEPAES